MNVGKDRAVATDKLLELYESRLNVRMNANTNVGKGWLLSNGKDYNYNYNYGYGHGYGRQFQNYI